MNIGMGDKNFDMGLPGVKRARKAGIAAALRAGASWRIVRWPGHLSNGHRVLFVDGPCLAAGNSAIASALAPTWVETVFCLDDEGGRATGMVGVRPTGKMSQEWVEFVDTEKNPEINRADRMGLCAYDKASEGTFEFPSLDDFVDIAMNGHFVPCHYCDGLVPIAGNQAWNPPAVISGPEKIVICYRCVSPEFLLKEPTGSDYGTLSTVLLTPGIRKRFHEMGWSIVDSGSYGYGSHQRTLQVADMLNRSGIRQVTFGSWDCYRKEMYLETWMQEPNEPWMKDTVDALIRVCRKTEAVMQSYPNALITFLADLPSPLLYGFLFMAYEMRVSSRVSTERLLNGEQRDGVPLAWIASLILERKGWNTVQEAALALEEDMVWIYSPDGINPISLSAKAYEEWVEANGEDSPMEEPIREMLTACMSGLGLSLSDGAILSYRPPSLETIATSSPRFWQTPPAGRPN